MLKQFDVMLRTKVDVDEIEEMREHVDSHYSDNIKNLTNIAVLRRDVNEILEVINSEVFRQLRLDANASKLLKFITNQLDQLDTKFTNILSNTNFRDGATTFDGALSTRGPLIANTLNDLIVENDDGSWNYLQNLQKLVGHMVDPTVARMKDDIVMEIYKHKNFSAIDPKKINDALMKLEKITLTRDISLDKMDDTLKEIQKEIKPLGKNINTLFKTYIDTLKASIYSNMYNDNIYIPVSTPVY